jgi:hypothetical protein
MRKLAAAGIGCRMPEANVSEEGLIVFIDFFLPRIRFLDLETIGRRSLKRYTLGSGLAVESKFLREKVMDKVNKRIFKHLPRSSPPANFLYPCLAGPPIIVDEGRRPRARMTPHCAYNELE